MMTNLLKERPLLPIALALTGAAGMGGLAMSAESKRDSAAAGAKTPAYRWTCVTDKAAFAGRDGAGALVFRGKMWLLGGWNPPDKVHFPKRCNSEVWSSTDGLTWTLVTPQAPWECRHTAGYVVHDGKMWIVGGDTQQGHYQNDVWSSEDGERWEQVTDNVPWGPRVLQYTVAFNGRIWIMGGQTLPQFAKAEEAFYNDVWNSADGANWVRVLEKAPWSPRGLIGGSVVFKNRMWILGGGTYDTPGKPKREYNNDVWSSADGVNWERVLESAPWPPREYHDVAVFDDRMWVMEGGIQGIGNARDVWCSTDGVNWEEIPDTPWAPRHAASVFVHDNALWMVAGNNMFPDVWKLTRVK
ncbi:MAG: galactose oxidase [Armatimonadetes bacterium]|nr:galactose oxidase [Armatimonadota bacterium]